MSGKQVSITTLAIDPRELQALKNAAATAGPAQHLLPVVMQMTTLSSTLFERTLKR
jgi:hypothetical protein